MIGLALRTARISQNVPLNRIAKDLEVDPSYLSHVEHGRRTITNDIIAAYQRHLPLLTADAQSNEAVLKWITWFRSFRPHNHDRLRARTHPLPLFETDTPFGKFCKVLREHCPLRDQTSVALVWESTYDYKTISPWSWMFLLHQVISSNSELRILFAPSSSAHDEEVENIIKQHMRCIQFKERVHLDSVPDLSFAHFPVDYVYVSGKFAIQRFAGREYTPQDALFIDAAKFNDPCNDFDKPLKQYFQRIANYRDQKIQLYFTHRELPAFFQDFAATEEARGDRYLFQSWPGSHERPPESYERGSDWWTYYQALKLQDDEIEKIASARKKAWEELRRRMKTDRILHICSRQVLEHWARVGKRPGFKPQLNPGDRLNQIAYMVRALELEQFEIAIVDHEIGREFGWCELGGERNLSWLVQGGEKLIVEGHAPSSEGELAGYQCIINDRTIAGQFAETFKTLWASLPADAKDRQRTIRFLEELKSKIKGKNGVSAHATSG